VAHVSVAERAAQGRPARAAVPRGVLGEWLAPAGRRDPVELLEEQAASRVPELFTQVDVTSLRHPDRPRRPLLPVAATD
jgi:hypothetical protein